MMIPCCELHTSGSLTLYYLLVVGFGYISVGDLQVNEEDRLPKVMCGECTYKLDLLSDFRDRAYKTETALLTLADEAVGVKIEVC